MQIRRSVIHSFVRSFIVCCCVLCVVVVVVVVVVVGVVVVVVVVRRCDRKQSSKFHPRASRRIPSSSSKWPSKKCHRAPNYVIPKGGQATRN